MQSVIDNVALGVVPSGVAATGSGGDWSRVGLSWMSGRGASIRVTGCWMRVWMWLGAQGVCARPRFGLMEWNNGLGFG